MRKMLLHLDDLKIFKYLIKIHGFDSQDFEIDNGSITELSVCNQVQHDLKKILKRVSSLLHLRCLRFFRCFMDEFPDQLREFTSLEKLMFESNYINEDIHDLPDWVRNFKKLTHLHLEGCNLESIPL